MRKPRASRARREPRVARRAAARAAKRPRTQPVPHPFLLPTITVK